MQPQRGTVGWILANQQSVVTPGPPRKIQVGAILNGQNQALTPQPLNRPLTMRRQNIRHRDGGLHQGFNQAIKP